jgi:UDP-3-O-[3-hydroxymyristoyl] N-acetylglucosamine deacetylase
VLSGAAATVRVSPRRAEGIVLRRAGAGGAEIRAGLASVTGDARRTSLGDVATVEHLLASAYALGLSALEIEIDGPEVPIADGSAAPFFDALAAAGADDLPGAQPVIRVTEPVWVRDGDRFAAALPRQLAADGGNGAPGLRLTYQVGLRGRGDQAFDVDLTPGAFRARVASARTWGYLEDVDALRTAELARGASLENTLVIDGGARRIGDEDREA